ncbi:uncharacterized protein LOC143962239 [Lithobates pipiens]
MASADVKKELLDCSVCLNIYTDPVTLRCGHNFCRVCIDRVLDTQDGSGVYSCPECRAESVERPFLLRNITLCNIVESFLFTQPTQDETGVFCTYCVDSPVPAVQSCLHCEASLCDKHLRVHSKAPEHVMMEPTTSLGNRKCSIHRELLKYYCIEDSLCVCVSCSLAGEHRGHQVEILDEASEKKKKRLRNVLQKLNTKREETERRVWSLDKRWKKVQENAAGEAERFSALLTDLRRKMEDLERKVLSEMSREEEKISLSISDMIQQLEMKKNELSRKIHHIEEICNMTDPLTVLRESDIGEEEADNEDRERYDKQIYEGGHLDVGLILKTLHTLSQIVVNIEVYVPKPADILLDINTAYNKLHISDDRKTASWSEIEQNRPKTAERFQNWNNVLSSSSFTSGRYYWDTDCSKEAWWRIGMCYPSIAREGDQSRIGENQKSWGLRWENNTLAVIHDSKEIQLPPKDFSKRVRVSLDYEAGQLSFYDLSEPIRPLHTFTATFTEPLHAALCVYWRKMNNVYVDSWVRILNSQKNLMPPEGTLHEFQSLAEAKVPCEGMIMKKAQDPHSDVLRDKDLIGNQRGPAMERQYGKDASELDLSSWKELDGTIIRTVRRKGISSPLTENVQELVIWFRTVSQEDGKSVGLPPKRYGVQHLTSLTKKGSKTGQRSSSSTSSSLKESEEESLVTLSSSWFLSDFHFHFFAVLSVMASADVRKELLDCSVCLNIYTDPVTLRCGHNFCWVCIDRVLDTQDGSGVYSCPECRAESVERPVLIRNITLCNIVESFLFTQPTRDETGVFCTYCVDSPVPAVQSCLHCEASLCDKHLRVHSKAPEHVMTEPTTSLGNRKCSIHRELLKYYCIEDSLCVCVSCSLAGEHRGHQVEILDEASEKKKKRLRNVLQELITKREETERRVRSLEKRRKKVQENAAGEAERFSALLTALRRKMEDLERKVLSEMSREEEKISLSISDMIQQLEMKKNELSRKIHHIEEMCNMTDPLTVLRESDIGEEEPDNEDRERYDKQIHDGGHLDVGLILQTLHTLSHIIGGIKIEVYVPKPADILLDINTAHNNLHISDDRKTASWSEIKQNRPKTPERFQRCYNVLSSSSFTSGRYYWDTDCSKATGWKIGMCYPSIEREGDQSRIGENNKSWCLRWHNNRLTVIHDSKEIQLTPKYSSNPIRISVDYEAGQMSFYELSQPIGHIHTFTATFTEPLHAALCVCLRKVSNVYVDSWVRILNSQKNPM